MSLNELIGYIEFENPNWLIVYMAIFLAGILIKYVRTSNLFDKINYSFTFRHPYYKDINNIVKKYSAVHSHSQFKNKIYYFFISGLLFLSLSSPYKIGQKIPEPPSNRDVLFVVDNEVSMVLKDYYIDNKRVERLTMVKSVLLNFANKLAGNRIGIVTFSEQAYTLLPFTTDTRLIKNMIPRIEATLTGRTSNPQKALIYSLNYLHNSVSNKSKNKHKPTIVLITDILRPPRELNPNIVAKYIANSGFKLYVIAIGASTYKKADVEDSSLIYHPASFDRLKELATNAKGEFYWAKNTSSLNGIIENVLKSHKSSIKIKPKFIRIPLFQWPLSLALAVIFFIQIKSYFRFIR